MQNKATTYLSELVMVGDFVPGVERTQRPDDGLALVGEDGQVEVVGCLQAALIRHDGVTVHESRVQHADGVGAFLQPDLHTLQI